MTDEARKAGGAVLADMRYRSGKTQAVAAARVGMVRAYVSQIETGFRVPSAQMLTDLLALYEASDAEVGDLFRAWAGRVER